MKVRYVSTLGLFLLATSYSWAQVNNATTSSSTLSGGINLRSIAGAPFSADVVNEYLQMMPDGTSARHATQGKMFRDSVGRTRSETVLESALPGAEARRYVTIVDPTQQLSMVLDLQARTGTVYRLPAAPAVPARDMKLVARAQAVVQSGTGTSAPEPTTFAAEGLGAINLGAMMMEGFSVTGTRRTRPMVASAAKDKVPNAMTESWFSSELKVELMATTQISPTLTRTTRLTNIVPGEPDPALFQVPADYAIRDNSQPKQVQQ